MIKVPAEFEDLLPAFKKKLFYGFHKVTEFWTQKYGRGTDRWQWKLVERRLNDQDLINHFFKDYFDWGNELQGTCLGFRPFFGEQKIVKRVMVDIDNVAAKERMNSLIIPYWDSIGIDWIVEHGRPDGKGNFEGAHYSFLTEAPIETVRAFLRQVFAEVKEPILKEDLEFLGKKGVVFDEVYGGNKTEQNMRFMYGFHIKRMFRGHLEYRGELINDPISLMKVVINDMKPVTEDFMKKYIKDNYFPTNEDKNKLHQVNWVSEKFIYQPLNLPIPDSTVIPRRIRPLFRNCPALNMLLQEAYKGKETELEEGLIQERGFDFHEGGFALTGPFRYHDVKWGGNEGRESWEKILEENRDRPEGDHNWWYGPDKDPAVYVYKCKTYDEKFDACKSCPFRGKIDSPRVFTYSSSTPISRTLSSTDIKLVTLKQVREKTFPEFTKRIKTLIDDIDGHEDLLLCSLMGTGKSTVCKELVADLIKESGINVLISVHDNQAGMAYRQFFKENGIGVFNLSSHASIFGHQADPPKEVSLADYSCPFYKEIQEDIKAGVQSSEFKSEFCESCPLFETCHYPNQYSQVMEEEYKVVIIQHAHLSCQEVMYKLLQKNFGIFFIDETFIDNTFDNVEIEQVELDVLAAVGYDWTDSLYDWLSCTSKATGKLSPTKEELDDLHNLYRGWNIVDDSGNNYGNNKPWRIPDLIRFYNQHRRVDELSGIEVVYEIPKIPIRVFLDATPPVELIKYLTGIDNLISVGDKEVIDITSIHPNHKRLQVIDISNSQSQLRKETFFETLMTKICTLIERDFAYRSVLLTVYSKEKTRVRDFITERFPHLFNKPYHIDIGLMNKGTNKWAKFDAQFIIAGRYRIGREYMIDAYRYRAVANFYLEKKHKPRLRNVYPTDLTQYTTINKVPKKVECLIKKGNIARIATYNDFNYWQAEHQPDPNNDYFWFNLIDKLDIGDMMQCERIRWDASIPDKETCIKLYGGDHALRAEADANNGLVPKLSIHLHPKPILNLVVEPTLFQDFLSL